MTMSTFRITKYCYMQLLLGHRHSTNPSKVEVFPWIFFNPHFYLQTVQMEVHLANGVMEGEAGRSSAPLRKRCKAECEGWE
jgi:hypothetical protein